MGELNAFAVATAKALALAAEQTHSKPLKGISAGTINYEPYFRHHLCVRTVHDQLPIRQKFALFSQHRVLRSSVCNKNSHIVLGVFISLSSLGRELEHTHSTMPLRAHWLLRQCWNLQPAAATPALVTCRHWQQ